MPSTLRRKFDRLCSGSKGSHKPSKPSKPRSWQQLRSIWTIYSEGGQFRECNNVEVFAAGMHRGKEYTTADLDEMVRNFEELGPDAQRPLLQPPVVLGHEEDQELLDRSDMPAAGWVKKLWREGGTLFANFGEVPPTIARLIDRRAYRKCSAEVYDDFACEGKTYGKALRRVALLGGEIPQVKTLADLPLTEYSEDKQQIFRTFSEVRPMSRDEMLAQLAEMGFDTAVLGDAPDQVLAEILRVASSEATDDAGDTAVAPAAAAPADAAAAAAPAMADLTDEEKKALAAQQQQQQLSDTAATTTAATRPAAPAVQAAGPKQVTLKYSERQRLIAASLKRTEQRIARLDAMAAKKEEEIKRGTIRAFCEAMVNEGKILSAEMDGSDGAPTIFDTLCSLDASKIVRKFGEKNLTALDEAMETIRRRPVLTSFAERFRAGSGGSANNNDDADLRAVQKFAERDQGFQRVLELQGKTPQEWIAGFKKAKEKMPKMTAAQYGVPEKYLQSA